MFLPLPSGLVQMTQPALRDGIQCPDDIRPQVTTPNRFETMVPQPLNLHFSFDQVLDLGAGVQPGGSDGNPEVA
jgi:hypothetical protein